MKKIISFALLAITSTSYAEAPKYTLNQVCAKVSAELCSKVEFCKVSTSVGSCSLAAGAQAYVAPLCQNVVDNEQLCKILEGQGNCRWTPACEAKFESFP